MTYQAPPAAPWPYPYSLDGAACGRCISWRESSDMIGLGQCWSIERGGEGATKPADYTAPDERCEAFIPAVRPEGFAAAFYHRWPKSEGPA